VNLDDLYAVLADVARNRSLITYGQLSQRYYDATTHWLEPHGSWDVPLGQLNRTLHVIQWPPLSAVVVLHESGEPGGGFWESSPNIPPRPSDALDRTALWARILNEVYAAHWPATLPTAPPT
jgi:hypothetical protein